MRAPVRSRQDALVGRIRLTNGRDCCEALTSAAVTHADPTRLYAGRAGFMGRGVADARIPSLSNLRMLEAAVRHGSVQRAALELKVTKTAVVLALERLSNDLSTTLCTSHKASITPTQAGSMLAEAYREASAILDAAVKALPVSKPAQARTAWVDRDLWAFWLGNIFDELVPKDGNTRFAVVSGPPESAKTWDVAIGLAPVARPRIQNRVICDLALTLVGHGQLMLPESPHDAAFATMPVFADSRLPWRDWLLDQGLERLVDRVKPVERRASLLDAALDGPALVVCHRLLVHQALAETRLREIPWLRRSQTVAKLYISRSYATTFGEDSRALLLKIKTAAIRAEVAHFDW